MTPERRVARRLDARHALYTELTLLSREVTRLYIYIYSGSV